MSYMASVFTTWAFPQSAMLGPPDLIELEDGILPTGTALNLVTGFFGHRVVVPPVYTQHLPCWKIGGGGVSQGEGGSTRKRSGNQGVFINGSLQKESRGVIPILWANPQGLSSLVPVKRGHTSVYTNVYERVLTMYIRCARAHRLQLRANVRRLLPLHCTMVYIHL